MIESGSCGGGLISTKSECEAAATALDLSAKTVTDAPILHYPDSWSYYPPGCVRVSKFRSLLVVLDGDFSTGSCSSRDVKCICKSTSP